MCNGISSRRAKMAAHSEISAKCELNDQNQSEIENKSTDSANVSATNSPMRTLIRIKRKICDSTPDNLILGLTKRPKNDENEVNESKLASVGFKFLARV